MAFKVIIENKTNVGEEDIMKAVWYLMSQGKQQVHMYGMGYIDALFEGEILCMTDVSRNGTDIFKFITLEELENEKKKAKDRRLKNKSTKSSAKPKSKKPGND